MKTRAFAAPVSLRLAAALLAVLSLSTGVLAQPAARPRSIDRGELVETSYPARALAGNLLGDPVEQPVSIYLPAAHAASPSRRFPTVYLLHGFTGKIEEWTTDGYQGMNLRDDMDELIRTGVVPPMIVVVPNGNNAFHGSFYLNSTTTGRWDDAISQELVAFVDGRYRTLHSSQSRGVAGHSMGGYGAIMFGMNHPDVFGSVYAMSPCCLGMEGDIGAGNPVWASVLKLKSRGELPADPQTPAEFWTDVFVATSAAFSPDPARPPFYAAFPFEEKDGRLAPAEPAYSQWRSKMPLYLVESNRAKLLSLRGLSIDVGDHDDFTHIRMGSRLFSDALAERDIPHVYEIYADGDHGNRIRERLKRAMRFFADTLQQQP